MKRFKHWTFIVIGMALLVGGVIIGTTQQNFGQSGESDRLMIERSIETAIATHDADIKKQIANLQAQIMVINRKLDEINGLLLMPEEERKSSIPKNK
jgi:peptidoglycan hydrolase CwlO-like protein